MVTPNIEFKHLKEKNEEIRAEIDRLIGLENPFYSPIWVKIQELIENELLQDEVSKK